MEYKLENLEASKKFAIDLSKQLTEDTVVLFYGAMGSGKTTLIRELGLALGIQERITSPTFIGMNEYHLDDLSFYHYDAYQVGVDFETMAEILDQPQQKIIVIEWAENLEQNLLDLVNAKTQIMSLSISLEDETRLVELKK